MINDYKNEHQNMWRKLLHLLTLAMHAVVEGEVVSYSINFGSISFESRAETPFSVFSYCYVVNVFFASFI